MYVKYKLSTALNEHQEQCIVFDPFMYFLFVYFYTCRNIYGLSPLDCSKTAEMRDALLKKSSSGQANVLPSTPVVTLYSYLL